MITQRCSTTCHHPFLRHCGLWCDSTVGIMDIIAGNHYQFDRRAVYERYHKTNIIHNTSGKWEISDHETKIFGHHSFFQGINDQTWQFLSDLTKKYQINDHFGHKIKTKLKTTKINDQIWSQDITNDQIWRVGLNFKWKVIYSWSPSKMKNNISKCTSIDKYKLTKTFHQKNANDKYCLFN